MPMVKVKENESFEIAMKRFKKQVEKAGILTELRRREFYDKPSIRKKKKAAAARKRALKKLKRMAADGSLRRARRPWAESPTRPSTRSGIGSTWSTSSGATSP
jgi:small subunit ribosomal protein S21